MTPKDNPHEKPSPAEQKRQERILMAIPRNMANKHKARTVGTSIPGSYAIHFDACVKYAHEKMIANPYEHRLIERETEYMFVQRAIMDFMNAIVLDAAQNGVYIGLTEENPDNTAP